jgi:diaminohydroxyphosphoribosylaminopyrimidine deaminase/5-amino-6-(5-phosphoribosylamino)uracil reductase
VIDKHLQLDQSLQLFNQQHRTIVFNLLKNEIDENVQYIQLHSNKDVVTQILAACYEQNIQSIIVEGGAKLLQTFIEKHFWDEARVITNQDLMVNEGLNAPAFSGELIQEEKIFSDSIQYFIPGT